MILPSDFYGCGNRYLSLMGRNRLKMIETIVLRMSSATREEITSGWRKLRTEEIYNMHYSPNI
jgi:hypothetical protein